MRLFYDMVDCIEAHTNGCADRTVIREKSAEAALSCDPAGTTSTLTASPPRKRRDSDWFDDCSRDKAGGGERKRLEPFVPRVLVNIARRINPF